MTHLKTGLLQNHPIRKIAMATPCLKWIMWFFIIAGCSRNNITQKKYLGYLTKTIQEIIVAGKKIRHLKVLSGDKNEERIPFINNHNGSFARSGIAPQFEYFSSKKKLLIAYL